MAEQELEAKLSPLIKEFQEIEDDVQVRAGDLIRMRYRQGLICLQVLNGPGWDGLEDMAAIVNFTPQYLFNLAGIAKKYTAQMIEEAINKKITLRKLIQTSQDAHDKRFSKRAIASLVQNIEHNTAKLSEMVDELGESPNVDAEVLKREFELLKENLGGQYRNTLLKTLFQIEKTSDTAPKSQKLILYEELKGVLKLITTIQETANA